MLPNFETMRNYIDMQDQTRRSDRRKLKTGTVLRRITILSDFAFPKGGNTAHDGSPDGRDRLPDEVVVCPYTKAADANAKTVDKTLILMSLDLSGQEFL